MSEDTKLTENQKTECIGLFPDWAIEKELTLGDLINNPEYKAAYEEWAKNNPGMQQAYRAFADGVTRPLVNQATEFQRTLDSVSKPFANQAIEFQRMVNSMTRPLATQTTALQRTLDSVTRPLATQTTALQRTLDSVTRPLAKQATELQRKSVIDDPGDIATLSNTIPPFTEALIEIEPAHLHVIDAIYETSGQMSQEIRSVKHEIEQVRSDIYTKLSSKQKRILGWVAAIGSVIGIVEVVLHFILPL